VGIGVAGYPEKHPEAPSYEAGILHLAAKVAEGADLVITQLFFEVSDFLRFLDDARRAGVRVPIVPGVLPITNVAQVRRFATLCGARIPSWLSERLDAVGEDAAATFDLGVEIGTRMCRELLAAGVPGIHFYTLNRSASVEKILSRLFGGRPRC
jgi:methylenetetrahydrofolate reductase (NADPH)